MKSRFAFFKHALRSLARFGRDLVKREEGQMAPIMMTAMLIGYSMCMGAAIDMSNLWVHKYRAMTAARAACMAGSADLAWAAEKGTAAAISSFESSSTGFPLAVATGGGTYANPPANASVSGTCSSGSSNAMCAYAAANGYSTTTNGVTVTWTVSNVAPSASTINAKRLGGIASYTYTANTGTVPQPANGVLPYLHVTVSETVPTHLLSLMPYFHSPVTVAAGCDCGLEGAPGPEQTITAACPFSEFAYNTGEWQSVQAGQIRTTGSNFGYGDSADYVFFNCDDTWIDQSGVSHAWNYLSTLPNVTIDDVAMRQAVGNQETGAGHAVVYSVVLVSSATPLTPRACNTYITQPSIPGMTVLDWAPTDYLVESVNKTELPLYESDTNSAYSPWRTQPPTWTETLPSYNPAFISNPDTADQFAEPSIWYVGNGGGSSTRWSLGADSAAIINALSTNRYFGFGWCFQGNDKRDFVGNPSGTIGSVTIYFHQGGTKVSSFANY